MALRFLDGFDHYATPQLQAKWPSQGNSLGSACSIAQGQGRESGGGALSVGGNNGSVLTTANFASESTWTVGAAVKPSQLLNTPLSIGDSTSGHIQLTVGVNSSGYLYATVAAGTYTATTLPLSVGVWTYIEGQVVISATAGTVTLRVNGNTVVSETGINTANGGTLTANTLLVGGASFGQPNWNPVGYLDDLYLFDGTGSANTTFPSAIPTVQCLWPNSPGSNAQWTGSPYQNFANVNDETPDGDYTVNQSGTAGQLDTFNHDDLRPDTGTVFAVQHCLTARTATATSHTIAAAEYVGTTSYVDTAQTLATGYSCLTFPHDTDPATGAAFTIADVNSNQYGYELVS